VGCAGRRVSRTVRLQAETPTAGWSPDRQVPNFERYRSGWFPTIGARSPVGGPAAQAGAGTHLGLCATATASHRCYHPALNIPVPGLCIPARPRCRAWGPFRPPRASTQLLEPNDSTQVFVSRPPNGAISAGFRGGFWSGEARPYRRPVRIAAERLCPTRFAVPLASDPCCPDS